MDGILRLSHVYPIYILDVISHPPLKKVRHTKTRYLDDAGEGVKVFWCDTNDLTAVSL